MGRRERPELHVVGEPGPEFPVPMYEPGGEAPVNYPASWPGWTEVQQRWARSHWYDFVNGTSGVTGFEPVPADEDEDEDQDDDFVPTIELVAGALIGATATAVGFLIAYRRWSR